MRKFLLTLLLCLSLTGCGGPSEANSYQQIDAEEAKTMMDTVEEALILDVRTEGEFAEGHIPDALLLPVDDIDEPSAAALIPDQETTVLVYCRSGNRSRTAAQKLADLGYTAVYEFGGIRDWPYDIVAE